MEVRDSSYTIFNRLLGITEHLRGPPHIIRTSTVFIHLSDRSLMGRSVVEIDAAVEKCP